IFQLKKADGSVTSNLNEAVTLQVRSHGSDGISGVEVDTENPYATDFPASSQNLVEKNDVFVNIDKLKIEFSKPVDTPPTLQLEIYQSENGAIVPLLSDDINLGISAVTAE